MHLFSLFADISRDPAKRLLLFWLLTMLLSALVTGWVVAYLARRKLRALAAKAGNLVRPVIDEEIALANLGTTLDRASEVLEKFAFDSQILQNLAEAMVLVNSKLDILSWNKSAAALFGFSGQNTRGKNLSEFVREMESFQLVRDLVADCALNNRSLSELVELTTRDNRLQSFWMIATPLESTLGMTAGASLVFKDERAVSTMRQHIQKVERLATLSYLAPELAHEVRNPLGSISILAGLIDEDSPQDDAKKRYAEEISKQVEHLNQLIEGILNLSRQPAVEIKPVDLGALLSNASLLARQAYPQKGVRIPENYLTEKIFVMGDAAKLMQAFLSIFVNAIEASPEGSSIEVSANTLLHEPPSQRSVRITVADQGMGIPPSDLDRIFEPFFSTKPGGSGLGLCLAYHIIAAHGGIIKVFSQSGRGSTFSVTLPENNFEPFEIAQG